MSYNTKLKHFTIKGYILENLGAHLDNKRLLCSSTHISVQINPVGTNQTTTSHGLPATTGSKKKTTFCSIPPKYTRLLCFAR